MECSIRVVRPRPCTSNEGNVCTIQFNFRRSEGDKLCDKSGLLESENSTSAISFGHRSKEFQKLIPKYSFWVKLGATNINKFRVIPLKITSAEKLPIISAELPFAVFTLELKLLIFNPVD